jgi:hypothetical protein
VRTLKTMEVGLLTHRHHRCCACGARWPSEQRPILDGLLVATNSHEPEKGAAISGQNGAEKPQETVGKPSDQGSHLSSLPLFPALAVSDPDPYLDPKLQGDRARGSLYSQAFTDCWRAYGRREEKPDAYAQWVLQARLMGGEGALRGVVLDALVWQGPLWAIDGWKFAPYFVRYLKRRKWEDERPERTIARATQSIVNAGQAWLAKKNGGNR